MLPLKVLLLGTAGLTGLWNQSINSSAFQFLEAKMLWQSAVSLEPISNAVSLQWKQRTPKCQAAGLLSRGN